MGDKLNLKDLITEMEHMLLPNTIEVRKNTCRKRERGGVMKLEGSRCTECGIVSDPGVSHRKQQGNTQEVKKNADRVEWMKMRVKRELIIYTSQVSGDKVREVGLSLEM